MSFLLRKTSSPEVTRSHSKHVMSPHWLCFKSPVMGECVYQTPLPALAIYTPRLCRTLWLSLCAPRGAFIGFRRSPRSRNAFSTKARSSSCFLFWKGCWWRESEDPHSFSLGDQDLPWQMFPTMTKFLHILILPISLANLIPLGLPQFSLHHAKKIIFLKRRCDLFIPPRLPDTI